MLKPLPVKVVSIHKTPICYNERVQKVYAGKFAIFYILLGSSNFSWNLKLLHARQCLWEMGQMYLSIDNNTPPKGFSIDFIHFKYCF